MIKEKGLMTIASRHVAIDGFLQSSAVLSVITLSGWKQIYGTVNGSDVTVQTPIFAVNDSPEAVYHIYYSDDLAGFSLFLYVNIIILGV